MGDDFYSAENNFGYSYLPDVANQYGGGKSPDPKVTYYSGEMTPEQRIPTFRPSDAYWDSVDIDAIHTAIFTLHDGHLNGAAIGWQQIVDLLNHVKQTMSDAGKELAPGWDPAKSTAANNFFQHIGASMWSIDDWILFSNQNKHALLSVATAVNTARDKMEKIYKNFLSEWNTNIDKANYIGTPAYEEEQAQNPDYNVGLATSNTPGYDELRKQYTDAAKAAREKYTNQARQVIKDLAGEYASNWGAISEGRRFQGPTNAESPLAALQDKLKQIMAGAGGGHNFGNPANFTAQNLALQNQMKQQADEAAKKAAEAEAAAKAAQEKALAEQKAAADQAKQQALEAQQKALEQQQLAQQQLEQQLAQQHQNVQLGDPVAFPVAGAGTPGLQNPGGLGNVKGGTGANFGNPKSFALGEPGAGGGLTNSNSLLGRSGLSGLGGAGGAGAGAGLGRNALQGRQQPGGGQPPGGARRFDERGKEGDGHSTSAVRPESEEYLADLPGGPGEMSARLTGQTFGGPMSAPPPPSTSLPGRGSPLGQTGGRPGPPGQGVPPGRTRPGEELTGRRRRTDDVEFEDELLAPPMLNRPNLTGRAGLPAIERVAGPGMGAESSMLGARGKKAAPDMAERLSRRRADKVAETKQPVEAGVAADGTPETELWAVDVPETIDTPVERKPDERRGGVLGPGA